MITPETSPVIAVCGDRGLGDDALKRLASSRVVKTRLLETTEWLERVGPGLNADFLLIDLDGEIDPFSAVREAAEAFPGWILVASEDCEMMDRVLAFEAGAHAFFAKPLEPREVVAKVRSLHRRTMALNAREAQEMTAGRMMIGGLNFDFTRRTAAARNGQRVHFTGTDWVALEVLARHSGQPVSRQQLCREVFNRDWAPDDRAVDKLVLRLRRRLRDVGGDAEAIQTVRNRGYALFAGAVPTRPQLVGGSVHDRSSILAFDH